MSIESDYPLWLLPVAAVLAAFLGWWVYYHKKDDSVIPRGVKPFLLISRALTIIIIALLIISPWIRTLSRVTDRPLFLIAQDNSRSMVPVTDSSVFIQNRLQLVNNIRDRLGRDFDVQSILFGENMRAGENPDYRDNATDFEDLFRNLSIYYGNKPVAGLLIASDGCFTRGMEPVMAARNFPFPVYAIASGDTVQYPDLLIRDVIVNEWVRQKSLFQVRVYFETAGWLGEPFKIRISDNRGIIAETKMTGSADQAPFADFEIEATEKGFMSLNISILSDKQERNPNNNNKTVRIRIIDKEGSILILYDAPHPDISAIQRALAGITAIKTESFRIDEFAGKTADYSLVIMHGLPSIKNPASELLSDIQANNTPVLYILSQSTNPAIFNQAGAGFKVSDPRPAPEEVQGYLNQAFSLFSLPEDFPAHLENWPPLEVPFLTYQTFEGSQVLMNQKIRRIELSEPLVTLTFGTGTKNGIISGTGIWRWRIYEYLERGDHFYFDDWVSRMVQYLMADEKEDRFKIVFPDEMLAFSPIRVTGFLRNNSLEAVNTPDVSLVLKDSAGESAAYTMGKVGNYYQLDLNGFKAGTYQYRAETVFGGEPFTREGEISITSLSSEDRNPVADFMTLRRLAESKNGRFFSPAEEENLIRFAGGLEPSSMAERTEFRWFDPINLKWLAGILVLLLSLEWFLRRWYGTR